VSKELSLEKSLVFIILKLPFWLSNHLLSSTTGPPDRNEGHPSSK
jgi:hypothetical protein